MDKKKPKIIAVDFDATLAFYEHGEFKKDELGEPIPEMVEKVKEALARGDKVVIFTARVCPGLDYERLLTATESYLMVAEWTKKVFGQLLPITFIKLPEFSEFWDDKAKEVIPNTGAFLTELIEAS